MRKRISLAAGFLLIAAHSANGTEPSPPIAPPPAAGAPVAERACTEPGITPPSPLGVHAATLKDYPTESANMGEQGDVIVGLLIRADGTVTDPVIERSSGSPRLDSATSSLVLGWRYTPATENGVPIACRWRAAVKWRLTDATNSILADSAFYPPQARASGEEGSTMLFVGFSEAGSVTNSRVAISSGYPDLDQAAMDYVKRLKFVPPQIDGKPMQSIVPLEVRWSLDAAKPD